MALKDLETRQVARRELKGMLAGYLHDRMARVPEAGCCRRCGDMRPALVDGMCACCVNELEHERERQD